MDKKLKERLIGVIVLASLAIIFIPIFLTEPVNLVLEDKKNSSNSENSEFVSKLKPVDDTSRDLDIKNVEYGLVAEESQEVVAEESQEVVAEESQEVVAEESQEVVAEESQEVVAEESQEVVAEESPSKNETLRTNEVGQMNWIVQIGSFSKKENAEKENLRAKNAGFRSFINPITQNNKIMYQVCLGPEYDEADANKLREEIKNKIKLETEPIVKKYP